MITIMTLSSCSTRLVDYTVISSKNVDLNIDRAQGKKTEGKKSYFLGIGFNLKDAIDIALESAGPEYDMLVDGVVRYGSYPFVSTVTVEGTAVNTADMRTAMGDEKFENWLKDQDVLGSKSEIALGE